MSLKDCYIATRNFGTSVNLRKMIRVRLAVRDPIIAILLILLIVVTCYSIQ